MALMTYRQKVLTLVTLLKGLLHCFSMRIELTEQIGIALSSRMSKTVRENSKGLQSYKEFKF